MELRMGLEHVSDREFVEAFESCSIAGSEFHHADHLRLAWLYVREFGETGAEARLLSGIRKMAEQGGSPEKFHYTMTVAWLRLVVAAGGAVSTMLSFGEWAGAHPDLAEKDALLQYYSKERLECREACIGWMEPDLLPLNRD